MRISHNGKGTKSQLLLILNAKEYEQFKDSGLDGPLKITWDNVTKQIDIVPSPNGGPIIRYHKWTEEYRAFQSLHDANENKLLELFGSIIIPENKIFLRNKICVISLNDIKLVPIRKYKNSSRNRINTAEPSNPPIVVRKKQEIMEIEAETVPKIEVEKLPELEVIEKIEPDLTREIATVRVTSAIIEAVRKINEFKKRFGGDISLEIDKHGMLTAWTMLRIGPDETD